ncbi:choice-of-anchor D domain-containing protein [bacterium]|nr:choice-of-anchor D domain-containing protein [bacterium]
MRDRLRSVTYPFRSSTPVALVLSLLLSAAPLTAAPVFDFSPKKLDFGVMQVGIPAVRYFKIYNRSDSDLVVSSLSWGSWSPLDSLSFEPAGGTVKPGDSLQIKCTRISWLPHAGAERIKIQTNIVPLSLQIGPDYIFTVAGAASLSLTPDSIPKSTHSQSLTIKGTLLGVLAFNPVTITDSDAVEMRVLSRGADSVVVALRCRPQTPTGTYQIRFLKDDIPVAGVFCRIVEASQELLSVSPAVWHVPSAADTFLVQGRDFFPPLTFALPGSEIGILGSEVLNDSLARLVLSAQGRIAEGDYSLSVSNGVNTFVLGRCLRLEYDPVGFSTRYLNFGQAPFGSVIKERIAIFNNTDTTVYVDTVLSSDSLGLRFDPAQSWPVVLHPFNSLVLGLTFQAPPEAGPYLGRVLAVCGADTAVATVTAEVVEKSAPRLELRPPAPDLPDAIMDSLLETTARVVNSGSAELNLAITADYRNGEFIAQPHSATLAPGDSLEVRLQVRPHTPKRDSLAVEFVSNDPDRPHLYLPLRFEAKAVELGNGVWRDLGGITLSTTELYFGEVPLKSTSRKGFVLRNISNRPISTGILHSIADYFRYEPDSLDRREGSWLELTLQPGQIYQVWVVFAPTEARYFSMDMQIGVEYIILTGEGQGWRNQAKLPKLALESLSLDLGIIKKSTDCGGVIHTQLLRNAGEADLIITGMLSPWLGIGTNMWRETLPPGGSYKLNVFDGCGNEYWYDRAPLIISSNDPDNPRLPVYVTAMCVEESRYLSGPLLAVFDSPLDFGILAPGDSATRSLRIANLGSGALRLNNIQTVLPDYAAFKASRYVATIDPGKYLTVTFSIKPSRTGESDSSYIRFTTNDPLRPTFDLPAAFSCRDLSPGAPGGQPPAIAVDSTRFGFGTVLAGNPVSRTITLSNTGGQELTVRSIHSPFLSVRPGTATIKPGGKKKVELTFATNCPLKVTDSLRIVSNDPRTPRLALPWSVNATGFGALSASPDTVHSNSGQQFVTVQGISYSWWESNLSILVKPGWGEVPYWQYYSPPHTLQIPLNPPAGTARGQHFIHIFNNLGFRDSLAFYIENGTPRLRATWPDGLFPPLRDGRLAVRGDFLQPGVSFLFDSNLAVVTGVNRVCDTLALLSFDLGPEVRGLTDVGLVAVNPDGGRDSLRLRVYPPVTGCDFNADGRSYLDDLIALVLALRDRPADMRGDLNGDGRFDLLDARTLLDALRHGGCPESRTALAAAVQPAPRPLSAEDMAYVDSQLDRLGLSAQEKETFTALAGNSPVPAALPRSYSLAQNCPNPFNPSTAIVFSVPEEAGSVRVQLRVFDLRGALVGSLVDGERKPGTYTVFWEGRNGRGESLPSGVYFYRLQAGAYVCTRKMVLLK